MKNVNVQAGPVEQVDRTWSSVNPYRMGDYEATGTVNEYTYAGTWEALQSFAEAQLAAGSVTQQVTVTLRRESGDMAKLSVRKAIFALPPKEEEDDGSTGDEPDAESNVEINVDVAAAMEDILTHPKFANVNWSTPPGVALQKLAAGADMSENFEWMGMTYNVGEQAQAVDHWQLVLAARSYYVPHTVVTVTKRGVTGGGNASVGEIVSKVPGVSGSNGLNWLTAGGGKQTLNGEKCFVQKYICSGPGGWNKDIYGG